MAFLALANGFSAGACVLISQLFGAGENEKMRRQASSSLLLITGMGLAATVVGVLISRFALRYLLATLESLMNMADTCFKIYSLGLVFQFGYNIIAGILRGIGDSKATLYFLLIASIISNIRMGFGHYRIAIAMASCARALGFDPLWLDLASFDATGSKVIRSQNDLYSLGSRVSQKSKLFDKLVWEPMNCEGFKKITYNIGDQKNSELLVPIFKNIDKDIPIIGTHVWPSQGAVHAGMTHVVNAIPDNWPMGLHLSEGAIHTSELGDGTPEFEKEQDILRALDNLIQDKELTLHMVDNIDKLKAQGTYDGAYECVRLAAG